MQLTIGMATYDDYDGVYFTIQALRLYHAAYMRQCKILVVDNHPDSPHAVEVRNFLNWVNGDVAQCRYIEAGDITGTAAPRHLIFQESDTELTMCIDSHVMLAPGALHALFRYYEWYRDSKNLIQGPMFYDDLRQLATHFEDEWRGEMWGTWATDKRAFKEDEHEPPLPAFEIPAQGLGLFACRTDAWLGFNPYFEGFGGEEFYIHTKYRQAGRKCLCLPALKWLHRFGRPGGIKYPLTRWHKARNYVLGHLELGLNLQPVYEHFVKGGLLSEKDWEHLLRDPVGNRIPPGNPQGGGCGSCNKPAESALPMGKLTVDQLFQHVASHPRDLDQHANTIRDLAAKCRKVTAFVKRKEWNVLLAAGRPKELIVYQSENDPLLMRLHDAIQQEPTKPGEERQYTSHVGHSSISLQAPISPTDMLVLDTVHSADRLFRELSTHAAKVGKWILLRGTASFGEAAEGGVGPGMLYAVRQFIKQHPEWTVVHHWRDQYGLMLLSRDPADKKPLPSVLTQGLMAAKASWRAGANVLQGYGPAKDTDLQNTRLSLCLVCPSLNDGRCAECGCPVDKKTSWPTEQCPIARWGTLVEEEVANGR